MDPVQILAECSQEALAMAMRDHGVTVIEHDDDSVLSTTSAKRVSASKLAVVLQSVGLSTVFIYGYGMKDDSHFTASLLNELADRGGAYDNVFDVGVSCCQEDVVLFKPANSQEATALGLRFGVFRGPVNKYPLFKHLGGEYGSVTFDNPAGYRVQIYQLWQHWLKAALPTDLYIPKTYGATTSFERKYAVLIEKLSRDDIEWRLGGYRIEITVTAKNFTHACRMVSPQLSLQFWQERGLLVKRVHPQLILDECKLGLRKAKEFGLFTGRASNPTQLEERVAYVDLVNLVGITLPSSGLFWWQLKRNGFDQPPWNKWPRKRVIQARVDVARGDVIGSYIWSAGERNAMASLLKWRRAMRGGYTLTMAGSRGVEWGVRWGENNSINPQTNERAFLIAMVETIVEHNVVDWRTRFVIHPNPRAIPSDLGFGLNSTTVQTTELQPAASEPLPDTTVEPTSARLDSPDDTSPESPADRTQRPVNPFAIQQTTRLESVALRISAADPAAIPPVFRIPSSSSNDAPRAVSHPIQIARFINFAGDGEVALQPQIVRVPMRTILSDSWRGDPRQMVLNFSPAERSSVEVTGSRERSPRRTAQSPQHAGYPSWARVGMSEDLRDLISRLANLSHVEGRRSSPISDDERKVLHEYVFQCEFHQPAPRCQPTSESFWKDAVERDGVLQRKHTSLHNHWKTVARSSYESYRASRLSEDLVRLSP